MVRGLVLLVLLLAAPWAAADYAELVDIRVTHLPDQRGWQVRYEFAKAIDSARFDGYGARRHRSWMVETPGLRLAPRDGSEYLEAEDGKSFRSVQLRFPSDDRKPQKEYQLTQGLSDGSEWLYTGHLYAKPLRQGVQERKAQFRLRLQPFKGEHVVVHGKRHAGPTSWTDEDPDQRGTFVYFGDVAPVESKHVIAIVDPALPKHLLENFQRSLPQLFAYYGDRTGYKLESRPQILISYRPDAPGMNHAGDALPGTLDFNFSGGGWAQDDPAVAARALHFIAHEAAHLWNGQRFDSLEQDKAPWMHEGGADAFAWLAARDLGLLEPPALTGEIEKRLNSCLLGLGAPGESLQVLFLEHRYELGYSCGSVMNMLVDAELRERGGLFALWQALFALAEKTGGRYSVEQYFGALEKLAGNGELSRSLRQLWGMRVPDPPATFEQALTRAGVSVKRIAPPVSSTSEYGVKAMAALMQVDCRGSINFTTYDDRFEVGGLPSCQVLKDRRVTIVALAGESIAGNGVALYKAVAKHCAVGRDVAARLAGSDEVLLLHCARPLPALPPYLALEAWPRPTK